MGLDRVAPVRHSIHPLGVPPQAPGLRQEHERELRLQVGLGEDLHGDLLEDAGARQLCGLTRHVHVSNPAHGVLKVHPHHGGVVPSALQDVLVSAQLAPAPGDPLGGEVDA